MQKNLNSIYKVLNILYEQYSDHLPDERTLEKDDILGILIQTILSQSTNNLNSDRAFESLLERFGASWENIAHAHTGDIANAITIGGLARQKAPRIKAILNAVYAHHGIYSLELLHQWPAKKAYRYLIAFKGVGPKTASFVLMRAAKMPFFAMDTHILRICKRLDWIDENISDIKAHQLMELLLPTGDYEKVHMTMVAHGRQICHARKPACTQCCLEQHCHKKGLS